MWLSPHLDPLQVVLRHPRGGGGGLGEEEGVVCVAGRMLLRLEQRVEVPEAALHVVVGRHLLKAHLSEDLAELSPNLGGSGEGVRV